MKYQAVWDGHVPRNLNEITKYIHICFSVPTDFYIELEI